MTFLTIREGRLVLEKDETRETIIIESLHHLQKEAPEGCMVSSSVDFPEEYTEDPNVIEMCRNLRG